jgi:hypothetical protein
MKTLVPTSLRLLAAVFAACFSITNCRSADAGSSAVQAQSPASVTCDFVIGISPFLDKSSKDEVYRGVVRLIVEQLPLNSRLFIYDAFHLKTITHISLPQVNAFKSPKTRANQFAPAIRDLKDFLAADHPRPKKPGARLDFDAALQLPQFCDFILENLTDSTSPLVLLLVGSPLYQDSREPGFSMVEGYFPSDGHLQASRDKSVFGIDLDHHRARAIAVHWLYFGDPWLSDLHREKISRFWTLYLGNRGAQLFTFTSDAPTALQAFYRSPVERREFASRWKIDAQQTKIEMLRITREVQASDWLTREAVDEPNGPPAVATGPMRLGIRWTQNIDLDLYATPRRGAETLFFQHPRFT